MIKREDNKCFLLTKSTKNPFLTEKLQFLTILVHFWPVLPTFDPKNGRKSSKNGFCISQIAPLHQKQTLKLEKDQKR